MVAGLKRDLSLWKVRAFMGMKKREKWEQMKRARCSQNRGKVKKNTKGKGSG